MAVSLVKSDQDTTNVVNQITPTLSSAPTAGNLLWITVSGNEVDLVTWTIDHSFNQVANLDAQSFNKVDFWKISDGTETDVQIDYDGSNEGRTAYWYGELDATIYTTQDTDIATAIDNSTTATSVNPGAIASVSRDQNDQLALSSCGGQDAIDWETGIAVDDSFTFLVSENNGLASRPFLHMGYKELSASIDVDPTWTTTDVGQRVGGTTFLLNDTSGGGGGGGQSIVPLVQSRLQAMGGQL